MKKMRKIGIAITVILMFFSVFTNTTSAQIFKPVKWDFSVNRINDSEAELLLIATIDKEWHLYSQDIPEGGPIATSFNFEKNENYKLVGKVVEPKPIVENDPNFDMVLKYFNTRVVFKQKIRILTREAFVLKGSLEFMCCDDKRCLPPEEVEVEFNLVAAKGTQEVVTATDTAKAITAVDTIRQIDRPDTLAIVADESTAQESMITEPDKSTWVFFWLAFLGGLLAILTPCVFPMIPMTVSFFMHGSDKKYKARAKAIFYGISIIAIYTLPIFILTLITTFIGAKSVEADFANWLSTHWIPNLFFTVIFLVFAASFFGMFEITLPNRMINRSDKQADRGGYLGSFFMAFTLVLVSFSCTGPIVGLILAESVGGGSADLSMGADYIEKLSRFMKPTMGMLGFSLAFALPFTLFAMFPAWLNKLPKSGGWLNSVKVVLGFIELALALKFLSIADQTYHWGILDREIYLALWIVIFALMGFYLLGKIKFPNDNEIKHIGVPRLMLAVVTFAFVVYMIPGLFGAPLKALSGYIPPQTTLEFDMGALIRQNAGGLRPASQGVCEKPKYSDFLHLPHGLQGYFDYEQGLACAKEQNKPIFIDFTGHGCVNCREMEANVWSDPRVLKRLREEYVIMALYVDDKTRLPKKEWATSTYDNKVKKSIGKKNADFQISLFNVNAQPYYVILGHKGELLVKPRAYSLNVDEFVEFLDKGIAEFKRRSEK